MEGVNTARRLWALAVLAGTASWVSGETLGACDNIGETIYVQDWAMLFCDRTGRRIGAGNICREFLKGISLGQKGRFIIDNGGPATRPEWHFPELCLPGQRQQRQKDPWKCHCTDNSIWNCFPSEDHFINNRGLASETGGRSAGRHDHNSTSTVHKSLGQDRKKDFWYCDEFGYKHVLINCILEQKANAISKALKKYDLPGFDAHDCLPGTFGVAGPPSSE